MNENLAIWQQILTILGGSAIGVAAVAWLIKSLTTHVLSKDVERFKQQLISAREIEIEKTRAALRQLATEHSVQFSSLHANREEIIIQLYSTMVDLYKLVFEYSGSYASKDNRDELFKDVSSARTDFSTQRLKSQLFFDRTLQYALISLEKTAIEIIHCVGSANHEPVDEQSSIQQMSKGKKLFEEQMVMIMDAIMERFQTILGVNPICPVSTDKTPPPPASP